MSTENKLSASVIKNRLTRTAVSLALQTQHTMDVHVLELDAVGNATINVPGNDIDFCQIQSLDGSLVWYPISYGNGAEPNTTDITFFGLTADTHYRLFVISNNNTKGSSVYQPTFLSFDTTPLEKAALEASPGPEHIYSHPRDSNNAKYNEDYLREAYPQYVLELLTFAKRTSLAEVKVALLQQLIQHPDLVVSAEAVRTIACETVDLLEQITGNGLSAEALMQAHAKYQAIAKSYGVEADVGEKHDPAAKI